MINNNLRLFLTLKPFLNINYLSANIFASERDYFLLRKIIILIFFIQSLFVNAMAEDLVNGSQIKSEQYTAFDGTDQVIPNIGFVTILFFFNGEYFPHKRTLSEFDFLISNFNSSKEIVKFIGITKTERNKLKKFLVSYEKRIVIINDEKERLFKYFNYSCGNCMQIVMIDKKGILKYLTSRYDPVFIRNLVERYSNE